ncbi:hypothetical protein ACX0G9_13300 [Flavitalea flava]
MYLQQAFNWGVSGLGRFCCFLLVFLFMEGQSLNAQVLLQTRKFRIGLDKEGRLTELTSLETKKSFLPEGQHAALLSIGASGRIIAPESLRWNSRASEIDLTYPLDAAAKVHVTLKVVRNDDYISLELTRLSPSDAIGLVIWGPYPTTIGDTVGEVVGVVRNKEFAIGIQALNIKTLGGDPGTGNDIQPSYDYAGQSYRGDAAKPTSFGSVLQAYCRSRDKDRIIANWGHTQYLAPAFEDGGIVGSKLALFGTAPKEVLLLIGMIEQQEHLPHPMLDGVWGKVSQKASESYLIMDFGVNNVREAMAFTHQAGLRYLYHGGPFETWGHFTLHKDEFPENWVSLKNCVDIAKTENIRLGLHTLSNFITTNDPYVTPVPDSRLARVGYSKLAEDIDAMAKEITIDDPAFFNQFQNNTLKSVVAGMEIIRYGSVSGSAPWKLKDCQRGAFGTLASFHRKGDSIGKLMDHGYQVFLGNHSLDQEIAGTIARLFNETGLMQVSFDGLEGCWSEGMGDYGKQLFTQTWYDQLKGDLKGRVINDASNPGHFFWHVYTRMNWGEPWYAGFRESHLDIRLKNQQFFRRNLMPAMLGWFSLKPETTLEDIEWMLARGAGFDAGFALATSLKNLKAHGRKDEILATIKIWETARQQGVFSERQKTEMRDIAKEFHLETASEGSYRLYRVYNGYFTHEQKLKQPGEPVFSTFPFHNPAGRQPAAFILRMAPGGDNDPEVTFDNLSITVNQQEALVLPVSLKKGQIMYCDGKTIRLYDKQWKILQTIGLTKPLPELAAGDNEILFDGKYSGENGAPVKMEIRAKGEAEPAGK